MNYTQGPIGLHGVDGCDLVGGEEDSVLQADVIPGLAPGVFVSRRGPARASASQCIPYHEGVEAEFGDLVPLITVVREVGQRCVDLLEIGISYGNFGV